MGRSQRSKVEVHGSLYLSPEGADWPNHPWWPGEPVGGGPNPDPAPTLTSLDPNTAELNAPDITMHCHGSGFTAESVIVFAGQDEPIVFISENEITTGITLSLPWGAVSVPVLVRNADGQETVGLDFTFTEAAASAPTLTALTPNSVTAGSSDASIVIDGTNFDASSVVMLNGETPLTPTAIGATQLTFTLPANWMINPATFQMSVITAAGTSNALPLTVEAAAPTGPVITSMVPAACLVGETPSVSVTGTGFTSSSVAYLDGAQQATTFIDSTLLQFFMPAASTAAADVIDVTVSNDSGATHSSPVSFTVTAAAARGKKKR